MVERRGGGRSRRGPVRPGQPVHAAGVQHGVVEPVQEVDEGEEEIENWQHCGFCATVLPGFQLYGKIWTDVPKIAIAIDALQCQT